MGTYSLEMLIRKWGLGELTSEQAIGQVLLILQELIRRLEVVEREKKGTNRKRPPGNKSTSNRRLRGR